MGIFNRIVRRKRPLKISIPKIDKCSIDDVIKSKSNSCTYSYLLHDNKKLYGELSCMVSSKFIEGDTLGTFNDYIKYSELIGTRQSIEIYNDNCNKTIFHFGMLKLIDVVMDLPDNDKMIIKLVWER